MKTETLLLIVAGVALYLQYQASQSQPGNPNFVGPVQSPSPSGNVILGPVQSITPINPDVQNWFSY